MVRPSKIPFSADSRQGGVRAIRTVEERVYPDSEFAAVRDFILTGVEAQPCCGITTDPLLLNGSFDLPVPVHTVALIFHQADPILGLL
jgi:hypothetical protein